MKSIQHPENHPVFMAIPPQPHHKTGDAANLLI